ncbi:MAG: hypothetical protein Tsb005_00100 [Gammaproteobacteria bacterium]
MFKKLVRVIIWLLAILIFSAALLITVLRLASPWINKHPAQLEQLASEWLKQPVNFESVSVTWHGLFPALRLQNIDILNQTKTRKLISASSLSLQFNFIDSLINWQFIPHELRLTNLHVWRKQPKQDIRLQGLVRLIVTSSSLNTANEEARFKLRAANMQITLPSLFQQPLTVRHLGADLQWVQDETGWHINMQDLLAANDDLQIVGSAKVDFLQDQTVPYVDINLGFKVFNSMHYQRYLPVKIMHENLVHWLKSAIKSADKAEGKLVLRGRLDEFPFNKGQGIFNVTAHLTNVTLLFAEQWPALDALTAELLFHNQRMQIVADKGTILGNQVKHAEAIVEHLNDKNESLKITGIVKGDLGHGIAFLQQSPLHHYLGKAIKPNDVTGDLQVTLKLNMPLSHTRDITTQGVINFNQGTLKLPALPISLKQIQGDLYFNEHQLWAKNIAAELFNHPVKLSVGHQQKQTYINFQGKIAADNIKSYFKTASTLFEGSTLYQGKISFELADASPTAPVTIKQITLSSNLRGLGISLPLPFYKSVKSTYPLQITIPLAQTQPEVILDAGKRYTARFVQRANAWEIAIVSDNIIGNIIWPITSQDKSIKGEFKRFYITPTQNLAVDTPIASIPAINFHARDFRYKDKQLGDVNLRLSSQEPKQVLIENFTAQSPAFTLRARGDWHYGRGKPSSRLQGTWTTGNLADALVYWGLPAVIESNAGTVNFDISWAGPLYDINLAKLTGDVIIQLRDGNIVKIDSSAQQKIGLARLLNILNLQSLPRRLLLNFRDLTAKGFYFRTLEGSFMLKEGNAITNNTNINGDVAEVEIRGRIGLKARDYDVQLTIMPYVTSSLPVVAAIAGGPIAGVVTWLASKVVNVGVQKIVAYHYELTGPWEHPKVIQSVKQQ